MNDKRNNIYEVGMDFIFSLFIILRQLYSKVPSLVTYFLLLVFVLLTLVKLIKYRFAFSLSKKCMLLVIALSGIICFLISRDPYILIYLIYSFSLLLSNKKTRIRNILYSTSFLFILVIFLSMIGKLDMNKEPIFSGVTFFSNYKLSLGFVTANYTFLIFNEILFLYYIYKGKNNAFSFIFWLLCAIILFLLTRSRTGFIISVLFLLTSNLLGLLKSGTIILISKFVLIMCITISFILALNIFNLGTISNSFLNERPQMWNYYLTKGISFFGVSRTNYVLMVCYRLYSFYFLILFNLSLAMKKVFGLF